MRRIVRATVALIILIPFTTRPGYGAEPQNDPAGPRVVAEDRITVVVDNRNFLDVRVYAVEGSRVFKLGNVTGLSRQTFRLPRSFGAAGGELQLLAEPIGARVGHSSQPLSVFPGDRVEYRIENALVFSTARLY